MLVRFLSAVTLGRLGVFMLPVGLFFVASDAPAGEAAWFVRLASVMTIARGLALWPAGHLLDRVGAWRGLRMSMAGAAAGLVGLTLLAASGAPAYAELTAAVVVGALTAPLASLPRALLAAVVTPGAVSQASAWEAASVEVSLLGAPLAAVWLAAHGLEPVLLGAAGAIGAAWVFFPLPRDLAVESATDAQGPRLSARIAALAGFAAVLGISGGMLEPALAALPSPLPAWDGATALLFVAIGVGSLVGGITAGRAGWARRTSHAVPLLVLHALGLATAVTLDGPGRIVALVVAGLPIAPLVSLGGLLLDRWSAPTRRSETFALAAAALEVGTGMGQGIAGLLLIVLDPPAMVLVSTVPLVVLASTLGLRGRT